MFPSVTQNDVTSSIVAHIKHSADFTLGVKASCGDRPHRHYPLVSHFCLRMIHSLKAWTGAMPNSIKGIFAFCAPFKIFKEEMSRNPVFVTRFMSWRAWTIERQQDETVYVFRCPVPIIGKNYAWITTTAYTWLKHFLWGANYTPPFSSLVLPVGSNRAAAANIVSWPAWYRLENLWRYGRILVSHGAVLLHRIASGSEPHPCENRGAA